MSAEIPFFEVPNYTLLSRLGEGAMAEVWLAEHKRNRRKAAIKILKRSVLSNADAEALFLREGEVLAGFDHPNIVKIYDNDKIGDLAYLAMEVLSCGSLLERMQRGPIQVGEALGLTAQIASALEAAHKQQIIHRDLKPANVMLRDETTPVLTDFGAVRLLDRSTIYGRDGSIIGTPIYMSPEQITGQPLTGSSDVYALGILFHELLVGKLPFPGNTIQEIATQHLYAPVPQLPAAVSMLQPVLEKLLAKLPDRRYTSAQAFIDSLRGMFIHDEALRRQVSYSGTSQAWSSQLRALGFMLDTKQSEEVRRAQGNYLGAHAETVQNQPVAMPVSKPRPTSAERSAAINAALLAKKSRVRVGDNPQYDRRGKLPVAVTEPQTAVEDSKAAVNAQAPASHKKPPLPAAKLTTPSVGAAPSVAVQPINADSNPAVVRPVTATTAVSVEASSEKAIASGAITRPQAVATTGSVIASNAQSRSKSGLWLAACAALLLIVGFIFWPSAEPTQPQLPPPRPAAPVAQTAIPPMGTVFNDVLKSGRDGPEMVVIPAGSFNMGSPENEADRGFDEGPQHRVTMQEFAIGKTEVTIAQYQEFVTATGYLTDAEQNAGNSKGCAAFKAGTLFGDTSKNHWKQPGFEQTPKHPAVCLSWNDAQAYVVWLALETGKPYRLPTEAEQEYSIRAGTATPYAWGGDVNLACSYANVLDQASLGKFAGFPAVECNDTFMLTSPVGSFGANAFGAYDLVGNVVEWTADCSNANYEGAPTDGSAWASGDCSRRVLSGAGWLDTPTHLRSAYRGRGTLSFRNIDTGMRITLSL